MGGFWSKGRPTRASSLRGALATKQSRLSRQKDAGLLRCATAQCEAAAPLSRLAFRAADAAL
ncbi:hypothetical protein EHH60_30495 [Bradyrhizobium sp. RP6]|nr:hypothetical protein EHH60_30495 [Bradyrhizobium sp. RP6]